MSEKVRRKEAVLEALKVADENATSWFKLKTIQGRLEAKGITSSLERIRSVLDALEAEGNVESFIHRYASDNGICDGMGFINADEVGPGMLAISVKSLIDLLAPDPSTRARLEAVHKCLIVAFKDAPRVLEKQREALK